MDPSAFLAAFRRARASAILRTDDARAAAEAMEAAVRAGFTMIEFTLTTPGALELVAEFSRRPGLVVGAGTVLEPREAEQAAAAGASFLVSPVTDEKVIAEAARLGLAMIPGAFTATEMLRAHRAGAPLQKLFPAPGIGPAYVRALLGPLPFLRIVPTAGVDASNAAAWLEAGAFAVGFVASLFDPADVRAKRFDAIEARGRDLLARVAPAR